jgi:ribosomal protein S18 acetylase RimI-like enzyme
MSLKLLPYSPELKSYFKVLNVEWLESYFSVTEEDDRLLSHPEDIIKEDGEILFVTMNERIVGTCALVWEGTDTMELIKMGVTHSARGKGAGDFLLTNAEEIARNKGAKILFLETAAVLEPAIGLYQKHGFKKTGEEHIHPKFGRKTFRMERKLDS